MALNVTDTKLLEIAEIICEVEERRSFGFSDWAFRFRERALLSIPLTEKIALEATDEVKFSLTQAL